ncbi:MAG: DnaB-like helicase C-terminal domain-containing protein [Caldilineaceae bacterium]
MMIMDTWSPNGHQNSLADPPAVGPAPVGEAEHVGPATLAAVMAQAETRLQQGDDGRFRPLATGFTPLDDVLSDGLRPGELLIVGGPYGVGKTIFGLQVARNVVYHHADAAAMYICYEHDRTHLMSRLLCLESVEQGKGDGALTLRNLAQLALTPGNGGLLRTLQRTPRYAPLVTAMQRYAERLLLVKASGSVSTLRQVSRWAEALAGLSPQSLLVVDYLQKIPPEQSGLQPEAETTTLLAQGLKELAMRTGLRIIAIAASDRLGLQAKRMRFADLRGSSALQYEADIGLVFNNKFAIVSREHLVYNVAQSQAMRNWVVMSVEKNRAGRNAVDMEFALDAAHFRFGCKGDYVHDRLIDEKVTLA